RSTECRRRTRSRKRPKNNHREKGGQPCQRSCPAKLRTNRQATANRPSYRSAKAVQRKFEVSKLRFADELKSSNMAFQKMAHHQRPSLEGWHARGRAGARPRAAAGSAGPRSVTRVARGRGGGRRDRSAALTRIQSAGDNDRPGS